MGESVVTLPRKSSEREPQGQKSWNRSEEGCDKGMKIQEREIDWGRLGETVASQPLARVPWLSKGEGGRGGSSMLVSGATASVNARAVQGPGRPPAQAQAVHLLIFLQKFSL